MTLEDSVKLTETVGFEQNAFVDSEATTPPREVLNVISSVETLWFRVLPGLEVEHGDALQQTAEQGSFFEWLELRAERL